MTTLWPSRRRASELDDDVRWLVALISDTGMRLAEAAGLLVSDIKLNADVPHIALRKHPWRSFKTRGSERDIPLAGMSLWVARRVVESQQDFAFPRYTDSSGCNANSASAAINKWLKPRVADRCVVHSFRHSLRDSLRRVECPLDMMPLAVGPPRAWARNMAAAMVSRPKPNGWKGSWFVHRGQGTTMLENQELEPRTTELMVPAERVRRLTQGPFRT